MNELTFLIELTAISAIFYVGFRLIKNHSTPTFKRYYLLVWMVCSMVFPAISLDAFTLEIPIVIPSQSTQTLSGNQLETEFTYPVIDSENRTGVFSQNNEAKVVEEKIDGWFMVRIVYSLVTLFFLARIAHGVFQIIKLKKEAKDEIIGQSLVYIVDKASFHGASFFKWIFVGGHVGRERALIIAHERCHSQKNHSFDVLFSHLYAAFFWINPFSWLLKKCISVNLELEADHLMISNRSSKEYARLLLDVSSLSFNSLINSFSAKHLTLRIMELTQPKLQKRWAIILAALFIISTFTIISCSKIDEEYSFLVEERINEIKSVTTKFVSHQSDTQQKTGKIVSIATFNLDGTIDEFVSRTTYPYDRDFDVKKEFWDEPIRKNIFYIMDGLTMGDGEKSLLYGNDWPKAYYKHLVKESNDEVRSKYFWRQKVSTDNEELPTVIKTEHINRMTAEGRSVSIGLKMPDVTEFFTYEAGKVTEVSSLHVFKETDEREIEKLDSESKKIFKRRKIESGKKKQVSSYGYDGELLKSIVIGKYRYEFFYEENVLTKSEYYIEEALISTRFHYYENGLKDRTEIFNRYNEPEYTILYEYEFWD